MRCATIFFTLFALLFSAADALAQDPLTAASRDAQHLAECTKSLDAYCVASLHDAKSYELLNRKQQNRFAAELKAKDLARYFDSLRRKGVRYTHFETSPPRELFNDGVRLYTFVPYARAIEFAEDKRWSSTISFLIALSAAQGKTWTFVDGEGLTPEQIRYILPSYADQTVLPRLGATAQWTDGAERSEAKTPPEGGAHATRIPIEDRRAQLH